MYLHGFGCIWRAHSTQIGAHTGCLPHHRYRKRNTGHATSSTCRRLLAELALTLHVEALSVPGFLPDIAIAGSL